MELENRKHKYQAPEPGLPCTAIMFPDNLLFPECGLPEDEYIHQLEQEI